MQQLEYQTLIFVSEAVPVLLDFWIPGDEDNIYISFRQITLCSTNQNRSQSQSRHPSLLNCECFSATWR